MEGTRTLAVCLGLVAGGCYTGSDMGPDAGGPPTAGADGSASADGTGGDTDGAETGEPEGEDAGDADFELGETPMRRLTRAQFVQSTRDLLEIPNWEPTATLPDEGLNEEEFQLPNMVAATVTTTTLGYSRYREVAKEAASVAFATEADLTDRLGCTPASAGDACVRDYLAQTAERAWSRRVEDNDPIVANLVGVAQDGATKLGSVRLGVQWAVSSVVQSPEFIYFFPVSMPEDDEKMDGYSIARSLSLTFRDSVPDAELLDLARAGDLRDQAVLVAQVERLIADMVADPARRGAVHRFFDEWWSMNVVDAIGKDPEAYPEFTASLRDAMKAEFDAWLADILFDRRKDFRGVLVSDRMYVNDELAALYGLSGNFGPELTPVDLGAMDKRSGLLTTGAFLSVMAHPAITSPAARGKFISERLLCLSIPPPPADVDTSIPPPEGPETKRDRFARHTTVATCAGCHQMMDPMGLALETFDAIGRYRETETVVYEGETFELDLDTRGELSGVQYADSKEMAQVIADDERFSECVTHQFMRHAFGRELDSGEDAVLEELDEAFREGEFDFLELMRRATVHRMFTSMKEAE